MPGLTSQFIASSYKRPSQNTPKTPVTIPQTNASSSTVQDPTRTENSSSRRITALVAAPPPISPEASSLLPAGNKIDSQDSSASLANGDQNRPPLPVVEIQTKQSNSQEESHPYSTERLRNSILDGLGLGAATFAVEFVAYEVFQDFLVDVTSQLSQVGGVWAVMAYVAALAFLLATVYSYYQNDSGSDQIVINFQV
jgi:hypothetical protein